VVWSGKELFALDVTGGVLALSDLELSPDPARFRHAAVPPVSATRAQITDGIWPLLRQPIRVVLTVKEAA
jgi:hypothetical protein